MGENDAIVPKVCGVQPSAEDYGQLVGSLGKITGTEPLVANVQSAQSTTADFLTEFDRSGIGGQPDGKLDGTDINFERTSYIDWSSFTATYNRLCPAESPPLSRRPASEIASDAVDNNANGATAYTGPTYSIEDMARMANRDGYVMKSVVCGLANSGVGVSVPEIGAAINRLEFSKSSINGYGYGDLAEQAQCAQIVGAVDTWLNENPTFDRLMDQRRYDEALEFKDISHEQKALVYDKRAAAHMHDYNYESASADFKEAQTLDSNNPTYAYHYALSLYAQGDYKGVQNQLEQAFPANSRGDLEDQLKGNVGELTSLTEQGLQEKGVNKYLVGWGEAYASEYFSKRGLGTQYDVAVSKDYFSRLNLEEKKALFNRKVLFNDQERWNWIIPDFGNPEEVALYEGLSKGDPQAYEQISFELMYKMYDVQQYGFRERLQQQDQDAVVQFLHSRWDNPAELAEGSLQEGAYYDIPVAYYASLTTAQLHDYFNATVLHMNNKESHGPILEQTYIDSTRANLTPQSLYEMMQQISELR